MKILSPILILLVAIAILTTCKKTPEIPSGNKIEIGETTIDSVSFYTAIVSTRILDLGGNTITQHGYCWSTEKQPAITDKKTELGSTLNTGTFFDKLKELQNNTIYYIRPYIDYKQGVLYGKEVSLETLVTRSPIVSTNEITEISNVSAVCGGVNDDGGLSISARGVCWSTSSNPSISNSHTSNGTGTGSFSSNLTGLTANTLYHIRAYATNNVGTSYGSDKTFTTSANPLIPTVTTAAATNIAQTTATSGGNVTSDGGASVTVRGVCWSTSSNPSISNSHTSNGTGTGSFSSNLTGLTANTLYHIRAYATNNVGTSYGSDKTFTTLISSIQSPSLIAPSNGSNVGCCYLTFNWTSVSNALTYELQLSKNISFTDTLYDLSYAECGGGSYPSPSGVGFIEVSTTSFCMNTGTSGQNGTWYWRVRAKNGTSVSNWSTIYSYNYIY